MRYKSDAVLGGAAHCCQGHKPWKYRTGPLGILSKLAGRRALHIIFACVLAGLASCTSTGNGRSTNDSQTAIEQVLTANPEGEILGQGNVRVALLIPSTIPGGAAEIAKEIRNGAAMAMNDFGNARIQLVIKDTKGQAAEAQAAAAQAAGERTSLILGPLFAANVSAAAGSAQPAGIPMLAFSTDTSVARRGVYLFSFTPQSDTTRMIEYAASTGTRSLTAFLPNNAEGNLRENILREVAGRTNININVVRYDRTPKGVEDASVSGAVFVGSSDSVYIPEGGPIPGVLVGSLGQKGINMRSKRVLGSGTWESVKTDNPNLEGAIYPGRDISSFNDFAARYEQQFGVRPGAQAGLAYDAVTLASELARINGSTNPFPIANLESNRGYRGVNGAFRILLDGTTERSLAIYKIQGGKGVLAEPAVSRFSGF